MKKGRKPKSKNTQKGESKKLITLDFQNSVEKKRPSNFIGENPISYDVSEDNLSLRRKSLYQSQTTCFVAETEGLLMDFRSESRGYSEKNRIGWEKPVNESLQNGQNGGPVTRRKEHQMQQSNSKGSFERAATQLNTVKKFDDYYKEKKNIENDLYLYHPPRVSMDLFQVQLGTIDTNNFNRKINYVQNFPVGIYS